MTSRLRAASAVVVVGWLLASLAAAFVVRDAFARVAYARASVAARALAARGLTGAPSVAPFGEAIRFVAIGDLATVRRAAATIVGDDVRRIGDDERALVLGRGSERVVIQPIKDADDWDVVGAAAVAVAPFTASRVPLLGLALAMAIGVTLALSSLTRRNNGRVRTATSLASLSLVPFAIALVFAVNTLARAMVTAPNAAHRVVTDADALPMPSLTVVRALLAIAIGLAVAASLAGAWLASPRRRAAEVRDTIAAWSFLAPSLVHVLAFSAGPLAFTLWLSLHRWDLLAAEKPFVGLANYGEMFGDALFWTSLRNTALYALNVPVTMLVALAAALLLDQPLRGVRVLRAIVFLPYVVSYVAIAMVWQWIYNYDFGLLNYLLRLVHAPAVDWLGDPRTALPAIMLVSVWVQLGFQMIVYLAWLQGIPSHLHEAASLDGASAWQRFRMVTLPLLRPVSVYLFVTGVIWSFQVFTLVYVMTEGGPVHATDVIVYQIYQNAWEFRRMGYASAMSWVLFAILIALTITQWKLLDRREGYA